jgi:hypothetical protein
VAPPGETVKRSALAGTAAYGYRAAHSRWYWGLKLYLLTTPDGHVTAADRDRDLQRGPRQGGVVAGAHREPDRSA